MRGDARIAGNDRHPLDDRLGGEEAVEGIAVGLAIQLDVRKAAIGRGVGS
ncbi:MAG TPA: hypothetical protein VFY04_12260 [Solirubrobacterales bacterium]|nr:hypothetical protein [Solirubrobacterales bacterium]